MSYQTIYTGVQVDAVIAKLHNKGVDQAFIQAMTTSFPEFVITLGGASAPSAGEISTLVSWGMKEKNILWANTGPDPGSSASASVSSSASTSPSASASSSPSEGTPSSSPSGSPSTSVSSSPSSSPSTAPGTPSSSPSTSPSASPSTSPSSSPSATPSPGSTFSQNFESTVDFSTDSYLAKYESGGGTVTQHTGSGGSPSVTGRVVIDTTAAASDKASVILRCPLAEQTNTYAIKANVDVSDQTDAVTVAIYQDTWANMSGAPYIVARFLLDTGAGDAVKFWYRDSTATAYYWNGGTNAWQTGDAAAYAKGSEIKGTYYTYKFVTSATGLKFELWNDVDDTKIEESDVITWANLKDDGSNPYYVAIGDYHTTTQEYTMTIDNIVVS